LTIEYILDDIKQKFEELQYIIDTLNDHLELLVLLQLQKVGLAKSSLLEDLAKQYVENINEQLKRRQKLKEMREKGEKYCVDDFSGEKL